MLPNMIEYRTTKPYHHVLLLLRSGLFTQIKYNHLMADKQRNAYVICCVLQHGASNINITLWFNFWIDIMEHVRIGTIYKYA